MSQELLILNKTPFGYHIDTYKYCQYLNDRFNITYLCMDQNKEKIESFENVKVIYTTSNLPFVFRGAFYFVFCILYTLSFNGKIFIKYFRKADLIKRILFWKKMILDIRTLSVSQIEIDRIKYDAELIKTCKYFDHISVISNELRKKMGVNISKSSILPLGADIISNKNKGFDKIKLLYVGILSGRKIEDTIKGFSLFCERYPDNDFTYDIIGNGYNNEIEDISKLIENKRLSNRINLHGYIVHNKLNTFFDKCNIGISYIPITEYYNNQPPTKTYEYILSGLYTIATATNSNREIINNTNGILIKDNPVSFSQALEFIYINRNFNSVKIRDTLKEHTWENIVNNSLLPILDKI